MRILRSGRTVSLLLVCLVLLIPGHGQAEVVAADHVPESGYWWPWTNGALAFGYMGHPAPLERYDMLVEGRYPGLVTNWYVANVYDPEAESWYGHCGDWAVASIFEPTRILPASVDNIIFRVGDKKGLLALAHNKDSFVVAGQPGSGVDADVFHEWLLDYLFDQRVAFVADLDPSESKWNYAIYRYDMTSSVAGNVESVQVTIYYADSLVAPDFMGTREKSKSYTYQLNLDGNGAITGGAWTGASLADHPERLFFPVMQASKSPDLDYAEVQRIVRATDDFLEAGAAQVSLAPGAYNLVLMDEDQYIIPCAAGNELSLVVEKQAGSSLSFNVLVTDGQGAEVVNASVDSSSPVNKLLTGAEGPFSVVLSQADYADPNIYTLRLDVKHNFVQEVPYIPKNGNWSGFALTNQSDAAVEGVVLATYRDEGAPLQTLLGPLDMAAGEKRVFLFKDLPWRRHEYSASDRLTLLADVDLDLLNLIGDGNGAVAGFVQGGLRGDHLVLPDAVPPFDGTRSMLAEILNEDFTTAPVTLRLYGGNGALAGELAVEIAPRATYTIQSNTTPFNRLTDGGWIEVIGDAGRRLSAYQYISEAAGGLEALFGLPVNQFTKIVPNIPPPGEWRTWVTLVNPTDLDNRIVCHPELAGSDTTDDLVLDLPPHGRISVALQDRFGRLAGDPLYHSILRLTGTQPFVGYYAYQSSRSHDQAKLPLLDATMFGSQVTLPHFAGKDTGWWTGVGLFNPSEASVRIEIVPHAAAGAILEGVRAQLEPITLAAGAYDVFQLANLLGDAAAEVSHVEFLVLDGQGEIGGFYLYGNKKAQGLAGANMR